MPTRLGYVLSSHTWRLLVQFTASNKLDFDPDDPPELELPTYYLFPASEILIKPLEPPRRGPYYGWAEISYSCVPQPPRQYEPPEETPFRPDRETLEAHKKAKENKEKAKVKPEKDQGELF